MGKDGRASLYDTDGWKAALSWQASAPTGIGSFIIAAAFSPDGSRLATGGFDFQVSVWDPRDGRLLGRFDPKVSVRRDVNGIAWSPDGKRIAEAGQDGGLVVRDAATGRPLWSRRFPGWLRALAWSPDGRIVASGGEIGRAHLFSAEDGEVLGELPRRESPVWALAFSPDSASLASGGGEYETGGGDTAISLHSIAWP
jgi:WD40 repeat protein